MHRQASFVPVAREQGRRGFTLIELLVVVTIIVVLLALLAPAMDKAVYHAELTMCAANQKGVIHAAQSYAMDHARWYPYREGVKETQWSSYLVTTDGYDQRPLIRPYLNLNKSLNDPLSGAVDLENASASSRTASSYYLYYGFGYRGSRGGRGMFRLGDVSEWDGYPCDLLLADPSVLVPVQQQAHCSHPDSERILQLRVSEGTITAAYSIGNIARGLLDLNFGHSDGAVSQLNGVEGPADSRLLEVSHFSGGVDVDRCYAQMPRK